MNKPIFTLEDVADKNGVTVPTLVKTTETPSGQDDEREEWCNVQELDQLFDACVKRWGSNWDLAKVMTAIAECEFD